MIFPIRYLPVESECCLQGDDLLLLSNTQDVPQVDAGRYSHWLPILTAIFYNQQNISQILLLLHKYRGWQLFGNEGWGYVYSEMESKYIMLYSDFATLSILIQGIKPGECSKWLTGLSESWKLNEPKSGDIDSPQSEGGAESCSPGRRWPCALTSPGAGGGGGGGGGRAVRTSSSRRDLRYSRELRLQSTDEERRD